MWRCIPATCKIVATGIVMYQMWLRIPASEKMVNVAVHPSHLRKGTLGCASQPITRPTKDLHSRLAESVIVQGSQLGKLGL